LHIYTPWLKKTNFRANGSVVLGIGQEKNFNHHGILERKGNEMDLVLKIKWEKVSRPETK